VVLLIRIEGDGLYETAERVGSSVEVVGAEEFVAFEFFD